MNTKNIPCIPADQPLTAWLVATLQRIHDQVHICGHAPDKSLRRASRAKEVMDITGLKRSTFYAKQNPKSPTYDPSFPRPFYVGKSPRWWELEIIAWLEGQALIAAAQH